MEQSGQITSLLRLWQDGNEDAFKRLSEILYSELHRLASLHVRKERPSHTLQATALVNEAYLRLVDADISYVDRQHFMSIAGRVLRRILVDYARSRNSDKRGNNPGYVTLQEGSLAANAVDADIIQLNDALEQLSKRDERKAQVVELNFFAGLSAEEVAPVLNISSRTAERDLKFAKAWLYQELTG